MVYLILTTLLHPWLIQRYGREPVRIDFLSISLILLLIPAKVFLHAFLADSFTYFLVAWLSVYLQTVVLYRRFSSKDVELSFFLMLCNALFCYISAGILLFLTQGVSFQDVVNLELIGQNNPLQISMTILLLVLFGVFRNQIHLEFREGEGEKQRFQSIFFILTMNLIILVMYNMEMPEGAKLILFVILNLAVITFYIRNRNLWHETAKDKAAIQERNRTIQELHSYVQTIETLTDRFQEFRHDMANMMVGLGLDESRIQRTIELVEHDLAGQSDYGNLLALRQIHHPSLKSLLYYYVMRGKEAGLKITLNVLGDVTSYPWPEVPVSRVMGILCENALEAAQESEEKILDIFIEERRESLTITIGNSYQGSIQDIPVLFEKGYSTRIGERGRGLYNLRGIIEENPGFHLKTLLQGNLFIQDLTLKKEAEEEQE